MKDGQERIAIIGLGYVGLPVALAFAAMGDHDAMARLIDGLEALADAPWTDGEDAEDG